ncbi:MAG: exo-beta-N-acetylmuramidase NamZ family protein [Nannocystaceae bacterium]
MSTGLDRLCAGEGPNLRGQPVCVLAHPASVNRELKHILACLRENLGATITSALGPEHGLDAAAQDMEVVGQPRAVAEYPVYSLYGEDLASLHPKPEMFHGAAWLICDLQDIGSRYYTYVWTVLMAAEVALAAGMRVLVLDRPNPLGGAAHQIEGGRIEPGEESFVGYHNVPTRHAMTVAEVVSMALTERGSPGRERLQVLTCTGWRRSQMFDATGLPWVLPSPNMPTLDTATIYPGQCLLEGTNLSEGRGTTRPFELFGAPFLNGEALVRDLDPADFPGLQIRPATFKPMFQKHAGRRCGGLQLHVRDRAAVRSLRSSWALLTACWRASRGAMKWRTEAYEFVDDRPAIDLLAGGAWLRAAIEAGTSTEELIALHEPAQAAFRDRRQAFLLYTD